MLENFKDFQTNPDYAKENKGNSETHEQQVHEVIRSDVRDSYSMETSQKALSLPNQIRKPDLGPTV